MPTTTRSTRRRIIEAARCLFWLNGYTPTTINEILARSNANSGSFYYLFKTKENVLLTVLNNNAKAWLPALVAPVFNAVPDPIDRIFGILNIYRDYLITSEFSCGSFIGKLALEIPDNHLHIHQRLAAIFDSWTAVIDECLLAAAPDIDPKPLSQFILSIMEGAMIQSRVQKSISSFDASIQHLRTYLSYLQIQKSPKKVEKETSSTTTKDQNTPAANSSDRRRMNHAFRNDPANPAGGGHFDVGSG